MGRALDRAAVQRWLRGQRAAARVTEGERVRFLLALTPEESLAVYLSLRRVRPRSGDSGPSPLLTAVRRALAKAGGGE